jgi:hypothetical protein
MNAASMSLDQHERGIHALRPVTGDAGVALVIKRGRQARLAAARPGQLFGQKQQKGPIAP